MIVVYIYIYIYIYVGKPLPRAKRSPGEAIQQCSIIVSVLMMKSVDNNVV